MLIRRGGVPLDYTLCNQTVTVYHRGTLERTVVENAYYDYREEETVDDGQVDRSVRFSLIVPGRLDIQPGDKVLPGRGSEIEGMGQWMLLTAGALSGLGVVKSVSYKYWKGAVCHTEIKG